MKYPSGEKHSHKSEKKSDKSKKSGMNKKVLDGMTMMGMPSQRKPMLRLHGSDAKRFMGSKPGSKVSVQIRGVVQSVGLQEYYNNEPEAEIRITKISRTTKAKKA